MSRGNGVSELATSFFAGRNQAGKRGNVYYRYNNFYSYGEHYILATKVPEKKFCWVNSDRYSSTTAQHMARFLAVASNMGWEYFQVDDCDPENFHRNAKEYVGECIEKLPKARRNFSMYLRHAGWLFEKYLDTCDRLGVAPQYENFLGAKSRGELAEAIAESDFKLKKKMVALQLLK
jgi:hypothetical protein